MNCRNCGNAMAPTEKFCMNCGTSVAPIANMGLPSQPAPMMPQAMQTPQPPQPVMGTPVAPITPQPMIGAPVTPPQPATMTPPVGVQPMIGAPSSPKNNLPIILGAVVVATIAIVATLVIVMGGDKTTDNGDKNDDNTNSNGGGVEKVVQTYSTSDGKYTYSIPVELYSEPYGGNILVYDDSETWFSLVGSSQMNTSNLNESTVKRNMTANGVVVDTVTTKKIDGKDYIVAQFESEGIKLIQVIYVFNTNNVLIGQIQNIDGTYGNDMVDTIAPILGDAVSGGSGLNSKVSPDLTVGLRGDE